MASIRSTIAFAHQQPIVLAQVSHVDRLRFVPRPSDQLLNFGFVGHRSSRWQPQDARQALDLGVRAEPQLELADHIASTYKRRCHPNAIDDSNGPSE
ncbi:MAG: hypothetical protein JO288_13440 [Hyphomicrobiales bacterium]|nr:hypothetical protein [Hyphomicrobiales bacterium]